MKTTNELTPTQPRKIYHDKGTKYTYYKVIQQYWGQGWEDVDYHECDSTGYMNKENRKLLNDNIRAYRENQNAPQRVVRKKN